MLGQGTPEKPAIPGVEKDCCRDKNRGYTEGLFVGLKEVPVNHSETQEGKAGLGIFGRGVAGAHCEYCHVVEVVL